MNDTLICEDFFVDFVDKMNGLLYTRKKKNIDIFDFNIDYNKTLLVCLTGYQHIIQMFFNNIIHKIKNNIILILIESDIINIEIEMLNNKNILKCYCWNKPYSHDKLYAIPIGLNYDRHYNSIIKSLSYKEPTNLDKKLLFACFNPDIESRKKLFTLLNYNLKNICDMVDNIPPLNTYYKESYADGQIRIQVTSPHFYNNYKKYKFTLSPRGWGEDTHRTWEALYMGCIPIVLSSVIDELYLDLPVLVINDWTEITEDFLNEHYAIIEEKKLNNKYNMNKLNMSYWTDIINQ